VKAALAGLCVQLACTPAEGPSMQPGADCMSCHNASHEFSWTAAGTVYRALDAARDQGVPGAEVELTDADGKTVVMQTTESGNFYTAEPLRFPLHSTVRHDGFSLSMPIPTPVGSCNSCHAWPPPTPADPGRLLVP
jgi:hypothetical protein